MPDSKRDTDVKNRFLDLVGEGEGGMIWENNIVTCILSYVEQIASPGSMYETGCSGLVHWDDPEGWDGEGGGRGGSWWGIHIHPCLIHVTVWQKPPQYCKVISLQLIKKKNTKRTPPYWQPKSDFQSPELWENKFLLVKLPRLWYFVMAVQVD